MKVCLVAQLAPNDCSSVSCHFSALCPTTAEMSSTAHKRKREGDKCCDIGDSDNLKIIKPDNKPPDT